jgi:hypothetical protein
MEIDTRYSLDLLRKINQLTVDGESISHIAHTSFTSAWASKQFFLLTQIKEYSKYKDFVTYEATFKRSPIAGVNTFLSQCFIVGVTFFAVLSMMMGNKKVLLFEADRIKKGTSFGPRLYRVFSMLTERHIAYMQCTHAASGMELLKNTFHRGKLVVYLEAIDAVASLVTWKNRKKDRAIVETIDLSVFEENEQAFVRDLLQRATEGIRVSAFKITLLSKILMGSSIKSFISIDDVRYTDELIEACRRVGIRSYIFQHSNFDYLMGLDTLSPSAYSFPDIFFVWNTYWLKKLPAISPLYKAYEDRLRIGARTYDFKEAGCLPFKELLPGEKLAVLIPYEIAVTKAQIQPYMQMLMRVPELRLIFQLRGDIEKDIQMMKYFGESDFVSDAVIVRGPERKATSFREAHVVAGVYSGFLDEAIEMCRPVVILETDYPIFNSLVDDDLVGTLSLDQSNVYATLKKHATLPYHLLEERRHRLLDGAGRLEDAVESILKDGTNALL